MKHLLVTTLSSILSLVVIYILPYPSLAKLTQVGGSPVDETHVVFARGKTSITISNSINNNYIFGAKAGQLLTLKINSLGGRAYVILYDVNGKPLSPIFYGFEGTGKIFSLRLHKTGNYRIFGYSGPSNHFYNFTLSIK